MNAKPNLSNSTTSSNIPSSAWFALGLVSVGIAGLILAGCFPLQLAIMSVFLFAGPHNWVEFRYFLTRLPARWGKLRGYFITAMLGVWGLTLAFVALSIATRTMGWTTTDWKMIQSLWNSAFILWILTLIVIRSHQPPRRDWFAAIPIGVAIMAVAWLFPELFCLSLVYLHPWVGFWILDLEITRSRPKWSRVYRFFLVMLPLLLLLLVWQLQSSPEITPDGPVATRILRHSGADLLPMVSNRLLVATHVFLELLHYGVWLVAIPLVSNKIWMRLNPGIPIARRSVAWRKGIAIALTAIAVAVVLLWGAFLIDYSIARDIYFTVAMVHVLAEVPFLLRAL
jgi:hypothetical protein